MIVACDVSAFISSSQLQSTQMFGLGFMPATSKFSFSNETKFPIYALSQNSIDFKNYSTPDGLEYTLHFVESENNRGIRVNDLNCFKNLWVLFKSLGARKLISLKTEIANFLPTATIFGQIKLA